MVVGDHLGGGRLLLLDTAADWRELVLLPDFFGFYASMDAHVLLKVALFGAMWGVGNVSYGLTMRHLGISLGVGVAIGVTLMVGTLMPPLLHGQAAMLFPPERAASPWLGVLVALTGVAVVSYAGHQKEVQLRGELREFNLKLGLLLAGLCGIFSSGMAFAIDAAEPMEAAALHLGVNPLYAALPSSIDGRVGLGHEVLKAPDQHVEAVNPEELALDVGQHVVAHVGEDGGEQAALLELLLPGQHGGVLRGPHAGVPEVQLFDGRRGEVAGRHRGEASARRRGR
jgi:hypothetical protein